MGLLLQLLHLVRARASDRARLAPENLLFRLQLIVLQQGRKRPRPDDGDRAFRVAVHRWIRDWMEQLVLVEPETVVRRAREGYRRFWKAVSQPKPGRPPLAEEVEALRTVPSPHELAFEDAMAIGHPPKLEGFGTHLFFIAEQRVTASCSATRRYGLEREHAAEQARRDERAPVAVAVLDSLAGDGRRDAVTVQPLRKRSSGPA
ncbi:MAG: hypothetical protein ACT4PV_04985 [Planctomycetaceae bacterium]